MFKLWILDLCLATHDWDDLVEKTWHGGDGKPARLAGIQWVQEREWDDYVMLG